MSRRKQSNRRKAGQAAPSKQRWIAPLLIVIGLLLIIGTALIGSAIQSGGTSTRGTPRAVIAQNVIDHGTVRFETPVESVFTIRNTGEGDLRIIGEPRVELVEGC